MGYVPYVGMFSKAFGSALGMSLGQALIPALFGMILIPQAYPANNIVSTYQHPQLVQPNTFIYSNGVQVDARTGEIINAK